MIVRYCTKCALRPMSMYVGIGSSSGVCTFRGTSSLPSYNPSAEKKKKQNDVQPAGGIRAAAARIRDAFVGTKEKGKIKGSGRNQTPINWNYPNDKFIDDYNPETTLEEVKNEAGPMMREQKEKLIDELKQKIKVDNPMMDSFTPLHNQADIEYHFRDEKQMQRWQTGCDGDWDEGFSKCELTRTEFDTALLSGYLDTRIQRDGRIERAGWASMKTIDINAFRRKRYLKHWNNYNHVLIKCRGDGRSYKVILYTPGYVDVTWGDCWSYPLHTHGGPYWQYARLPFSRFIQTVGGRIQDKQHFIYPFQISNVGIVLMDRQDGPFRLEVEYVGVIHDCTHNEKHAYEAYSLPIYNTDTL